MHEKKIRKHRSSKELTIVNSVYKKLGIDDINVFYADKFVWNHGPNIVKCDPTSRFNIAYLKQYWIYNNVAEGASVLDVGCGSGTLSLLKSKRTYLVGADLSEKGLEQALLAGYDEAVLCDGFDIPYPDKSFDFVVSLDVLGHIENEVKDKYLAEWLRLLKDDGVMLHGIEADDICYDGLSEDEKEHILTDGHVGLESFDRVEERFKRYFVEVTAENCMGSCYNWYDIEKYEKTEERVGKDFREYLLTFSSEQIKAFNAAMLLMRNLLAKDNLLGTSGGFMFVKARKKRPAVSIIIVNYNGRDLLPSCLESIHAQSFREIEVIVVDNGSQDGSVEFVRDAFPDTKVIALAENTGFPAANNEGLRHASGDYILLLNNDVEVSKDCIASLYAAMEGDPAAGIGAAKMLVAGTDLIDSAGDGFSSNLKGFKRGEGKPAHLYNESEYVLGACAGAAMYRRKMIDEIGFLDEDFFLIHEDADFNLRAQLAGWKVRYVPSAVVHHKVRSTIRNMSDIAVFYSLRNSELTRIKNIPCGIFVRCLPAYFIATLLEFLYFGIRHRKLMLFFRAKLDALRMLPKMLKKRREVMLIRKVSNRDLYSLMTSIGNREFFSAKISKFLHG